VRNLQKFASVHELKQFLLENCSEIRKYLVIPVLYWNSRWLIMQIQLYCTNTSQKPLGPHLLRFVVFTWQRFFNRVCDLLVLIVPIANSTLFGSISVTLEANRSHRKAQHPTVGPNLDLWCKPRGPWCKSRGPWCKPRGPWRCWGLKQNFWIYSEKPA